jgi:SAM-dependent methyltransferase
MTSRGDFYHSVRLAAGYAFSRPPVHREIIRVLQDRLGQPRPVARALDIGCGAGLSSAALAPVARTVVGLEPALPMLAHRHAVAPGAWFVAGRAEDLPFADASFDLVTAAGAINYTNLDGFLPELARVLAPSGVFVVYDFSAARRLAGRPGLHEWYGAFERRFPPPGGYDLDVRTIPWASRGLRLDAVEPFVVSLPMTLEAYLRYVMSEAGVEVALAGGTGEDEILAWCAPALGPLFANDTQVVEFDAYLACVRHEG